jgi:hypothetical protein
VRSDRQAGTEDLVFQIGSDAFSPRRPEYRLATLHAQPPSGRRERRSDAAGQVWQKNLNKRPQQG